MTNQVIKGAGFIIYRRNKDGIIEFLALEAFDKMAKRDGGKWDIPKGGLDPGEDPMTCAIRECYEEACIWPKTIYAGPMIDGFLYVWIANTLGIPKVGFNPKYAIKEHKSVAWLSPDEMERDCFVYLKPFIKWARRELGA